MNLSHNSGSVYVRRHRRELAINVSCSAVSKTEVCASVSGIRCPGPTVRNSNRPIAPFLDQFADRRNGYTSAV
ncbi:hypothetical protein KC848_24375, partial [Enterobacter hormaechei]